MNNIITLLIKYGVIGIIIASFSEAIFLPIPIELISIPVYLANTSNALFYTLILIVFSTLGSVVGYYLGKFLGPLFNKFISIEIRNKLKYLYDKNSFTTILTSCFTPIPYEAYILSAGFLNVRFNKFILAAFFSRVIRHLPQGILIALYGDMILSHLNTYTLLIGIILFCILILIRYIFHNNKNK